MTCVATHDSCTIRRNISDDCSRRVGFVWNICLNYKDNSTQKHVYTVEWHSHVCSLYNPLHESDLHAQELLRVCFETPTTLQVLWLQTQVASFYNMLKVISDQLRHKKPPYCPFKYIKGHVRARLWGNVMSISSELTEICSVTTAPSVGVKFCPSCSQLLWASAA